jgi:hypothetical protein
MANIDRVIPPYVFGVSTVVTAIIAGWFALTFAFTVGGLALGA